VTTTRASVIVATVLGALAFGSTQVAHADNCPGEDIGIAATGKLSIHVEYVGGKAVTKIETPITICGITPRPTVMYVVSPQTISYAWEAVTQNLAPRILASLKTAPF
jgi:hypothetical protein